MQKQYGLTAQGEALPKFRHPTHSSLGKWLPLTQHAIAEYEFVEEVDYTVAETLRSPNSGSSKARPQRLKEYALSLDVQQSTIRLAAAKSAAEIGVSKFPRSRPTLLRGFLSVLDPHLLRLPCHTCSAASAVLWRFGRGHRKVRRDLWGTGYANLVRAATILRLASSGGRDNLTTPEAAIMATVPTPVLPTIFTPLSYRRRACRLAELRRIRTTATSEAQACANHADLPTINTLLEQLSETLEQTDLSIQERAQFCALLDALRIEVGLGEEDLS